MLGVLTFFLRQLPSCGSSTNGAPYPLGGRRHFDMAHPEFGERVDDRVDHRSQRRCRTAFAAGTDAKPIVGAGLR